MATDRRPQVYNLLLAPIVVNSDDGTRVISDWPPIIRTLLDSFDGVWAVEYERKVDSTLETLKVGSRQSRDNLLAAIEQIQTA